MIPMSTLDPVPSRRPPFPAASAMRALTVWQPWADAIAYGDSLTGKGAENRPWPAPRWIIGTQIAVHAGLRVDHAAVLPCGRAWPGPHVPHSQRVRGAVIAVATVAGCHHERQCRGRPCSPWAVAGQYHWELEDRRPLREPVPARGFQRLWRLAVLAESAVRLQLGRAPVPEASFRVPGTVRSADFARRASIAGSQACRPPSWSAAQTSRAMARAHLICWT